MKIVFNEKVDNEKCKDKIWVWKIDLSDQIEFDQCEKVYKKKDYLKGFVKVELYLVVMNL